MAEKFDQITELSRKNQDQSLQLLSKLLDAARPEAVYSNPVNTGETKVFTASEISVGLGYGHGLGEGPQFVTNLDVEGEETSGGEGMGTGGGGGGGAGARPVAVITITGDQVRVTPIFDVTKIALAFFTMLGSIFFLGTQVRKGKIRK